MYAHKTAIKGFFFLLTEPHSCTLCQRDGRCSPVLHEQSLKRLQGKVSHLNFFSSSISVGFIIVELSTVQINEAPSKLYKQQDPFSASLWSQSHCFAVNYQLLTPWNRNVIPSKYGIFEEQTIHSHLLSEAQKQHRSKSHENSMTQFPARLIACPSTLSHNNYYFCYYYYYYYYYCFYYHLLCKLGYLIGRSTTKKN